MNKILLSAALFIVQTTAIQVSQALQKIRAESAWRQEVTNKFNWNATQELKWSVINAFIDVQTSPDGDVYAIQNVSSEFSTPQYHIYLHNTTSNKWTITNSKFQAKAVRFDRLGNIYYLSSDNCVLNSEKKSLVCGLKDFEVTVDKKIYGLNDGSGILATDTLNGQWNTATSDTTYSYKALAGYKGLTLLKDQPIFIAANGQVDSQYGSEKLISISAGIDGSLWALQDENDVKDYQLLKWQIVAQKWYKVNGAKGINLSVYNEISVAIVDSSGLLSLSSQVGQQNEVSYIASNAGNIQPEPTLSSDDINWLKSSIQGRSFSELTHLQSVLPDLFTAQDVYASFKDKQNIFVIYTTSKSRRVGLYFQNSFEQNDVQSPTNTESSTTTAVLAVTDHLTYQSNDQDKDGKVYQTETLATGVKNNKAEFEINLDCGDPTKHQRSRDVLKTDTETGVASDITGETGDDDLKQNEVETTCVQIDIYQGQENQ